MIITLLLICQVGGEWVQISQQHYRKPYRPTKHFPGPDKLAEIYEEDVTSEDSPVYFNQSLSDIWKEADKTYTKGSVIRVQTNEQKIQPVIHQKLNKFTSSTPFTKDRNYIPNKNGNGQKFGFINDEDEDDVSDLYNFKFSHSTNEEHDEKHLFSSEETTTGVKKYQVNDNLNKFKKFDTHDYKHHRPSITESAQSEDEFESSHVFPKMGNIKRVQLDSRTVRTPILKHKDEHTPRLEIEDIKNNNKTIVEAINENKIMEGTVNSKDKQTKKNSKANSTKELQNQMGSVYSTETPNHKKNKQTLELDQLKDINGETQFFVTKDDFVGDMTTASNKITNIVKEGNTEPHLEGTSKVPTSTANNPKLHYTDDVEDNKEKYENKGNTMENLMKLMKTVADTISKNTRWSVNSKVRYLQNLQDTILANIKQRIDTIWPDDMIVGDSRNRRNARAAEHTARGHVEFPSSESALMTISFLTFAVYLIKLILQVIQAFKDKAVMMSPAVITTVGRTSAFVHRHSSNSN